MLLAASFPRTALTLGGKLGFETPERAWVVAPCLRLKKNEGGRQHNFPFGERRRKPAHFETL